MKSYKSFFFYFFISFSPVWAGNDIGDVNFCIANYKGDKVCAISYTFDDGLAEHYTLVAPKLKELGFKGTFWINGFGIS